MMQNFMYWWYADHCYNPFVVSDNGDLVPSEWEAFAKFFNQEYTSRTAAMTAYQ